MISVVSAPDKSGMYTNSFTRGKDHLTWQGTAPFWQKQNGNDNNIALHLSISQTFKLPRLALNR
jgi:hypothetical protein